MKKIFLTIAGIFIVLNIFSLSEMGDKTQTFKNKKVIQLEKRKFADISANTKDSFETRKSFVSPVYKTDFLFTALGLEWSQNFPVNTEIRLFMRYYEKNQWTPWKDIPREIDEKNEPGGTSKISQQTALLLMNPSKAFQYQAILLGDGEKTPAISNMEITAINAQQKTQIVASASDFTGITDLGSDRVKIISRSGWGADESLRIYKPDRPPAQLIATDAEYLEKFSDELAIVRKIKTTADGQDLTWPLEYPDKVNKIIIHHTASTSSLDNPAQAIRNIYHWHAIGRGWGDIGYNYVIDPQGRIYEGRAGGEGVVGGHAGKANVGSIGISILGNYEQNDIPEKSLVSLMKLIGEKTKIHGIDPDGKSLFRGEITPNILGHRDVMSTSCPGKFIYEKLKTIRSASERQVDTTQETAAFKKQKKAGFNYEDESKLYYISLDPQKPETFNIKIKNTGTVAWNEKTRIIPQNTSDLIGILNFSSQKITPGAVNPGEIAVFEITLTGGVKPQYRTLKLTPSIEGKALGKYILLPVNITAPILSYEFMAAKWPKSYLKKGEKISGWMELKNTGNVSWKNTGDMNIRIGTDRPRDRMSSFLNPANTRIAFLTQEKVDPGQVGRFIFKLQAPEKPGNYAEYFTPVIEGISWLADSGIHFDTYIYKDLYSAEVIGMNIPILKPQESGGAWIKIKNTGGKVWKNTTLKITGSKLVKVKNIKMAEDKVNPGQTATFELDITAPKGTGKKIIYVQVQMDGKNLHPQNFTVPVEVKSKVKKVESAQIENEKGGNNLRVLLADYKGNPEIRSRGGAMIIQSGKNTVATIPENEIVSINYENSQYMLKSFSYNDVSDEPVRVIAGNSSTILEIKNYERRPDWNKALNDNEFRGVLEIRYLDGGIKIINELPIESYLKGLAEMPNDTHIEKLKAIIIAARTYAYYYSNIGQKFPGKPYHLDDDPEHTQKYRGYGYEKRSPNAVKAVSQTSGMVVTYNGQAVLTPYFSTSDGRTRSAQEVWGWTNTPYLVSADDPYCKGQKLWGHGVGMSGCGALGMAQNGKKFDDILHYYYKGIVLKKVY